MFLLNMAMMTNIIPFPRINRTPTIHHINQALARDDEYSLFLARLDNQLDIDHMFAAA
ncbi:MAG: hypothetical protein L0154_28000 [Chloroflexi bacterium]|nr:hypothetical protein [Chloroflexota bacterium]